jgi:ABC-type transporter Mla maintaining outer membrane lipid asymmetry permease subunit MlaE
MTDHPILILVEFVFTRVVPALLVAAVVLPIIACLCGGVGGWVLKSELDADEPEVSKDAGS